MTNQIETTLETAFYRCTKDGGRIKRKGGEVWFIVLDSGEIRCENPDDIFKMFSNDLARVWIYEPPQKSAFQEWYRKEVCSEPPADKWRIKLRKEGWNAAIGAVLKLEVTILEHDNTISRSGHINIKEIEALKEP